MTVQILHRLAGFSILTGLSVFDPFPSERAQYGQCVARLFESLFDSWTEVQRVQDGRIPEGPECSLRGPKTAPFVQSRGELAGIPQLAGHVGKRALTCCRLSTPVGIRHSAAPYNSFRMRMHLAAIRRAASGVRL